MIVKNIEDIQNALKSFGKDLFLATRINDIIRKANWNGFAMLKQIIAILLTSCRLHEAILSEQLPLIKARTKENMDNIYG